MSKQLYCVVCEEASTRQLEGPQICPSHRWATQVGNVAAWLSRERQKYQDGTSLRKKRKKRKKPPHQPAKEAKEAKEASSPRPSFAPGPQAAQLAELAPFSQISGR